MIMIMIVEKNLKCRPVASPQVRTCAITQTPVSSLRNPCHLFIARTINEKPVYPVTLRILESSTLIKTSFNSSSFRPVRIVYLMMLSGRASRQVKRLFKQLYDQKDYVLIHVDSRQDLMYREMSELAERFPNVRMVKNRKHGLWGGVSLLEVGFANCDLVDS